jgi:hypothetical protein
MRRIDNEHESEILLLIGKNEPEKNRTKYKVYQKQLSYFSQKN